MGLICFTNSNYNFRTIDEALDIIRSKAQDKDEIWVSDGGKYPCIAVCINGDFAGITFFESEDGNMYLSLNKDNQVKIDFVAGGEEWLPDPDVVISKELSIEGVREFLETGKRPECIEWQEL